MLGSLRCIRGNKVGHQCAYLIMLIGMGWCLPNFIAAQSYDKCQIITGAGAEQVELNIAHLLAERLHKWPGISAEVFSEGDAPFDTDALMILLGLPTHHDHMDSLLALASIKAPSDIDPGPEGFVLSVKSHIVVAAGVDLRGCLYAVGQLLREMDYRGQKLEVDKELFVRSAPAFEIRGTQFGQSGVVKRLAGVRDWSMKETQRAIMDYALAGANVFSVKEGPIMDFLKSFDLMTQGSFGANTAPEIKDTSWSASESIGRLGYVCLSVEAARKYMLEKCDRTFRAGPAYDLVKFHGGDGGGCECDDCNPYGLTFIKLVEQMAAIIHKYHPFTRVYFTNQKFDDEDDRAIFQYLNEEPREWLWAWGYGPGSDATTWQPGHRQTHRMDLFRYPGYGPYGLYPKEILHQLPPQQTLVYYNEITHWRYAQHAYIQMYPRADREGNLPPHWSHDIYDRRPDQALTMVYDRLTFYAWPRQYHRVFNDLMRYGCGDITHSSGHHDHFNQWMWQRLLWAPRTSVEDVVDEYCATWFGRDAVEEMSRAIFQLEENLEDIEGKPLSLKRGIKRYYDLVKTAGDKIAPELLPNHWLYRMYLQKGALDLYIQHAVRGQEALRDWIQKEVDGILEDDSNTPSLDFLLSNLHPPKETEVMVDLKEEARILGEESNQLYGVRSEGYFNLQHDFVGLGWMRRQIERAIAAPEDQRSALLRMITRYEDPGDGGCYDNLGTYNHAPHVVSGYPYDHGQPYVYDMLSEGNLPSQRSMHYTQDEAQGVTLQYDDLDTQATYKIRFTFVRPWFQSRYDMRMNQRSQSIYADDTLLAHLVELPLQMSDFFEYEIPTEATNDGELTIRLQKQVDVAIGDRVSIEQWRNSGGWGTIVSEVWLIKNP